MLSIFSGTIMPVCLLWKDVYLGLLPPFLKFVFNYSGFTMALPLFKILILLYCICYVSYHIFGRGLPGRSPDGREEQGGRRSWEMSWEAACWPRWSRLEAQQA